MPDFNMKQQFPMGEVINAAQRKAQLDNETTMQQSQLFNQSLQAIGSVGKSLMDKRRDMAQALAIGKLADLPDDVSRSLNSDQAMQIYQTKNKGADISGLLRIRDILNGTNSSGPVQPTPPPPTTPTVPVAPGASLPSTPTNVPLSLSPKPEAVLASNSPTIPMPAHTETPPAMPFGGASTPTAPAPATPAPVPVPIQAPPTTSEIPRMNPATVALAKTLGIFPSPEQKVVTREAALAAGSVPKGAHILPDEKGDTSAQGSPAYEKNQQKLEKQYADMKMKVFSNRSGGLGLEDLKVNQAIHLRQAINKQYDPKTGEFVIPPSLHTEFALGLARLMSPGGQVANDLVEHLRQGTLKEKMANLAIASGLDPQEVGGTTQSVIKFFVNQIDRQGVTAEENREGDMAFIHGQAPTDLEQRRIEAHDKRGLNSFRDLLTHSPDKVSVGINLQGSDGARLAELRAKKAAGTLKK